MRPSVRPRMLFARTKHLFSVKDGAAYLGLAETTLRRHITAGSVPSHLWGQRRLLWRDDLDSYVRLLRVGAG